MISSKQTPVDTYRKALESLVATNFSAEIEWHRNQVFREFEEHDFLCEAAWVVLNSGFRESVVRSKFDNVSLCFLDWRSAKDIVEAKEQCVASALQEFGHVSKISSIAMIAERVDELGFENYKRIVRDDPIGELAKLPHIGPITVWHLAKNLGFNVAKPDRHLVRLAIEHGYECVHEFCQTISDSTGEYVAVIDLVLWRYVVSQQDLQAR